MGDYWNGSEATWERLHERLDALLQGLPGIGRVVVKLCDGGCDEDGWYQFFMVYAYPPEDTREAAETIAPVITERVEAILGREIFGGDVESQEDDREWCWCADVAPARSWQWTAAKLRRAERGQA